MSPPTDPSPAARERHIRALWRACQEDGPDAALDRLEPDVEVHAPGGTVLHGREALRAHWHAQVARGLRRELVVHRFEHHGECVLGMGAQRLFSPDGGFVDAQVYLLHVFAGPRLVRAALYQDYDEALAAAEGCAGAAPGQP